MKTDESPKLYKLTVYKCSQCGQKGIPLDGPGTDCISCDGEFDTETPASQTHEMTENQAADVADAIIEEV